MNKIYIGNDHAALEYKTIILDYIKKKGFEVYDQGTYNNQSCDYNDFALSVCKEVIKNDGIGILICGSGIGISIMANKVQGIRCGQVNDYHSCKQAYEIGCNVISFGARIIGIEIAKQIVDTFLTLSSQKRIQTNIDEINEIEKVNFKE